jgi:6-phosphogluconate dehydrogenase
MAKQQVGLIGLAVMGQNLVLNIESRGYGVAVYNRTYATTEEFLSGPAKGKKITGAKTLEEFVGQLERPCKIILMVKAGKPVDDFIEKLLPLLEPGDLIIDGGNSHFPDTIRRSEALEAKGYLLHRHRRLRRRRGRPQRPEHHARRPKKHMSSSPRS